MLSYFKYKTQYKLLLNSEEKKVFARVYYAPNIFWCVWDVVPKDDCVAIL